MGIEDEKNYKTVHIYDLKDCETASKYTQMVNEQGPQATASTWTSRRR